MSLPILIAALAASAVALSSARAQSIFGAPETFVTTGPTSLYAAPSLNAEKIGEFAQGAGPIEAVRPWSDAEPPFARVALGERDGWAPLDRLAAMPVARIDGAALPVGLSCGGTEPFWHLELDTGSARYSAPWHDRDIAFEIADVAAAEARGGHPAALLMSAPEIGEATAFIRAGDCSDGMSDQTYPWSIGLLLDGREGRKLVEGCCKLPAPPLR